MVTVHIRKDKERGLTTTDWLKSQHTFSFAEYYDTAYMGFSVLRVINEDNIRGGRGFGKHQHQNMEIISYVVEGELEHKDSMDNKTIIKPGEIQRMSAGTGILHSEYNHLTNKNTHFIQVWILPEKNGISPSYAQKNFSNELNKNDLILVCSKDGREGSISINQNISLYACKAQKSGKKIVGHHGNNTNIWIQVVHGKVEFEKTVLEKGDGASIAKAATLEIKWSNNSEFLVFDLP